MLPVLGANFAAGEDSVKCGTALHGSAHFIESPRHHVCRGAVTGHARVFPGLWHYLSAMKRARQLPVCYQPEARRWPWKYFFVHVL